MKVFLTGGTGALGQNLLPLLVKNGYSVTAVVRTEEKAKLVGSLGATPVKVDIFSESEVKSAVKGHDIVINIATNIPSNFKDPKGWDMNDKIRTVASKILAEAALEAKAKKFIQESITYMYADNKDKWIDEEFPKNPNIWGKTALVAEANVMALHGTPVKPVILRFGAFYGPGSNMTPGMIKSAKWWISPFFGHKQEYQSLIYLEDAAEAVVAAIDAEEGIYNIVDDQPMTKQELDGVLAKTLGKIGLLRMPTFMVSKSSPAGEFLFKSSRVSNQKFKLATGWKPKHQSPNEGFKAIVEDMHKKELKTAT